MTVKLLAIAGSGRTGSLNKRLAAAFVSAAKAQGADAQFIDIASYGFPLYCGDLERDEAILDKVRELSNLINDHDGLFIACPEYNSSITPLLKNTLDWLSRMKDGTPPASALVGKTIALGSTSMGVLGGIRCLTMMCGLITAGYQATVLPQTIAVPQGHERLGEDGTFIDDGSKAMMDGLVENFLKALG